jgi:DNA-binding MurR/RpiR family transcriptional regulator
MTPAENKITPASNKKSPQSIFELVQSASEHLTPAEKRVARVLIADYPAAGLLTVAQLGERSGVSGQTVLRFAASIGCDSYPAFQQRLIEELKTRSESPLSLYGRAADKIKPSGLLSSSQASFRELLDRTFAGLAFEEFNHAVRLMADRKLTLFITGGRFTDVCADYLARHVSQLRPGSTFISSDSHLRTDALVDIGRKSVVVVFDVRRYQPSSIQFATEAKQRGAQVILITDPYLSPIAKVARVVLPVQVEFISPFDSTLAAIALVEMLVAAMLNHLGRASRDRIAEVEKARATSNATAEELPPTPTS